jgi:hypothetical protein
VSKPCNVKLLSPCFFVIWCVASNSRVTDEWLERIWRKWSWPNLRYYPVIFWRNFDILCQDCWSSGRDMTLIHHEYKADLFPSEPQHLVSSIVMIWHEWGNDKLLIILVCKSLGNRTLGRLSNRCKNNTMISVLDQKTYWSDTEQNLVINFCMVINLGVLQDHKMSWLAE